MRNRAIELGRVVDVGGPRGGEIAEVGVVRALGILNAGHQLRDEEVQVRVALAVGVRHHVYWRPRHRHGEVAAVIEVEAAQEVLVRLPLTAVLGNDDAGDRLEHLALPHEGPHLELPAGDGALACRRGDAYQILRRILDVCQIGERPPADDHDLRVQRQVHHLVVGGGRARLDGEPAMTDEGEVDQPHGQVVDPLRHAGKRVIALAVGHRHQRLAGAAQFNGDARETAAGFVGHPAPDASRALGGRGDTEGDDDRRDQHSA
jgi:hypothetical protein